MTGPFSSFFGLADNPFRANPDPRYLVLTQQTQESLDQLIEGIRSRKACCCLPVKSAPVKRCCSTT
jgi:hypothetical protein